MKYLIYLRVSTDEQDEETQLDHCLRFIKQKDASEFKYEVFRDKITSRRKLFNREGGIKLLNTLRKGDTIVAIRLDRISRSLHETTQLIEDLEEKGASILLVDQPGIKNKIMLGLYAGMAEEEINLLRQRVKEKLSTKKNRNERYSGQLPYGYAMHETKLVPIRQGKDIVMKRGILIPVHEEQQMVARMQELFDMGMSYKSIAMTLNNAGYRNREGNPFQKMSIFRILRRLGYSRSWDPPQDESIAQSSHALTQSS